MKGGWSSSDTDDIPERQYSDVRRLNNAQALSAARILRWTCVGAKCNTDDTNSENIISFYTGIARIFISGDTTPKGLPNPTNELKCLEDLK